MKGLSRDPIREGHMCADANEPNRTRAQHYVPRFYLRHFTSQNEPGELVHCYDKTTGRRFATGVNAIAFERDYYDVQLPDGGIYQPEPELAEIEGRANIAVNELLQAGTPEGIPQESKERIAAFVALQMLRGPLHRQLLVQTEQFIRDLPGYGELPEQTPDELRRQHVITMADLAAEFTGTLMGFIWTIFRNPNPRPFWTSDNPVSMYNPIGLGPLGNIGLQVPGICISIPLTPREALHMCDPNVYMGMRAFHEITDEEVQFGNSMQTRDSVRYLFSPDGDFGLADQWLAEHPQHRDPKRPLFEEVRPEDFMDAPGG